MKMLVFRYCLLCIVLLNSCHSSKVPTFSLPIVKDSTNEFELKNNLFVFVGEKISVVEDTAAKGGFDMKSNARYRVIETVYGHHNNDTIDFDVYDHMHGIPPFANYKNALLFVNHLGNNIYVHEKYQYFDVYKTQSGKWASTYDTYRYARREYKKIKIKLYKIDFAEDVSFDVSKLTSRQRRWYYPKPYFKIENGKAIPMYGVYLPDLFKIKKEGVLKARELF